VGPKKLDRDNNSGGGKYPEQQIQARAEKSSKKET
jgi:hypothetical protein